ncbi:MaoC/PaaZ C-terminal domain-containing protein [Peribacillus faecalis]|uniref:MaoC/PaaZ C-terminal domain-containing protein n=1 Tax=Peribacillus faecalis TaxID=2772559 RepID=UPI002E280301|nr:MaoC/PaaZ C-terminal domain-containing protein [Peribacillus faecalis]
MSLSKFEELYLDREIEAIENDPISKVQLVKYAGASGDFNPLHTDDQFANKAGIDGVIAHGMLSMGLLGKYVRQTNSGTI